MGSSLADTDLAVGSDKESLPEIGEFQLTRTTKQRIRDNLTRILDSEDQLTDLNSLFSPIFEDFVQAVKDYPLNDQDKIDIITANKTRLLEAFRNIVQQSTQAVLEMRNLDYDPKEFLTGLKITDILTDTEATAIRIFESLEILTDATHIDDEQKKIGHFYESTNVPPQHLHELLIAKHIKPEGQEIPECTRNRLEEMVKKLNLFGRNILA